MILRRLFSVAAVLAIGILAGILIGTGMDHYVAGGLPEAQWVAWRQVNAWVFPTFMPWIFNGTFILLVAAAVTNRKLARWLFGFAAVLSLVAILVTVRLEVPMNHMISSWTLEAVPANWESVRDHWLRNHLVRTIAGTLAFICATIAAGTPDSKT